MSFFIDSAARKPALPFEIKMLGVGKAAPAPRFCLRQNARTTKSTNRQKSGKGGPFEALPEIGNIDFSLLPVRPKRYVVWGERFYFNAEAFIYVVCTLFQYDP